MRNRGFTLLEVMVAGGILLLLVSWSTMTLISFRRTLGGLQQEGDQMARAAHALEHLQREILQSQPLAAGNYTLGPESLAMVGGITLANGQVSWGSVVQGPARSVALRVWLEDGHRYVQVDWEMPPPLPRLKSLFDATVLP